MSDWISAADVGSFTFCPEAYRLGRQGAKPDSEAAQRMAKGTAEHVAWSRRPPAAPHHPPSTPGPENGSRTWLWVAMVALIVLAIVMLAAL